MRSFPIVQLTGTIGVINYNHILALRQLDYPYHGEPNKKALNKIVISDMYQETLQTRRVCEAWNKIVKINVREIGKICCYSNYRDRTWLKENVENVKLPFHILIFSCWRDVFAASSQGQWWSEKIKRKVVPMAMQEENEKLLREKCYSCYPPYPNTSFIL
jgi:hypothetical protein